MKTPDKIKKGLECCAKASEEACKHCPYCKDCDIFEACNLYRDALAYITKLEQHFADVGKMLPEWISVKDRLPEDDDDVLILIYGKVIGVGYRINGKWKSIAKAKAPVVTHWMSLPEPPKEE